MVPVVQDPSSSCVTPGFLLLSCCSPFAGSARRICLWDTYKHLGAERRENHEKSKPVSAIHFSVDRGILGRDLSCFRRRVTAAAAPGAQCAPNRIRAQLFGRSPLRRVTDPDVAA